MKRKVFQRLFLLLGGLLFGIIAGETILRLVKPPMAEGGILQSHFPLGRDLDFEADDECGFRPKIDGRTYNAQGCVRNQYNLQKSPGKRRVLFVGDSVTRRAFLIDSLQKLYGDAQIEYWNAGVESFNTHQETIWYRRYNRQIQPDLVIVSFHNNDFMNTPVVYLENGQLQLLTPLHDKSHLNLWLFQNSYLYRCYVGRYWSGDSEEKVVKTRQAMRELQSLVAQDGAQLRAILVPLLRPLDQYDKGEVYWREQAITLFQELKIDCHDPAPALEAAFQQKIRLEQRPGDYWHPNRTAADLIAEHLYQSGILR